MYTWVIVINKMGAQEIPTQIKQTNKQKRKQLAKKTQRKLFLKRTRDTGQRFFFFSPNTHEELLC